MISKTMLPAEVGSDFGAKMMSTQSFNKYMLVLNSVMSYSNSYLQVKKTERMHVNKDAYFNGILMEPSGIIYMPCENEVYAKNKINKS